MFYLKKGGHYQKEAVAMKLIRNTVVMSVVAALLFVTAGTGFGAATEITGTVEQKGEVVILFSPDDSYELKGSDMLDEMIGKKVTVTGTIEEEDQVKILSVAEIEEVKEK